MGFILAVQKKEKFLGKERELDYEKENNNRVTGNNAGIGNI